MKSQKTTTVSVRQIINGQALPIKMSLEQLAQVKLLRMLAAKDLNSLISR